MQGDFCRRVMQALLYLPPLRRGSWLTDRGTDSPTEIHRRSQHAVMALGDVGLSRTEARVGLYAIGTGACGTVRQNSGSWPKKMRAPLRSSASRRSSEA